MGAGWGEASGMGGGGVEVACDESGSEGERLIGGNTDVFAHAGVRLTPAEADAWLTEVRRRVPTPATEFFAGHILREKHLGALRWALGPDGPFHGRGHVFLVDKSFLVVTSLLDFLHAETSAQGRAGERARTLYRQGARAFGAPRWEMFLASANDLLRTANGRVVRPLAAPFPQAVDALLAEPTSRTGPAGCPARAIVAELARAAPRLDATRRARLGTGEVPILDPMIPALVAAVAYWSPNGPVSIVHDRHTGLTPERLAVIRDRTGGSLARLTFAVSGEDARIQLADVLAGVARKLASDELNGHADPDLTTLISPYLDNTSIWSAPFWNQDPRGS